MPSNSTNTADVPERDSLLDHRLRDLARDLGSGQVLGMRGWSPPVGLSHSVLDWLRAGGQMMKLGALLTETPLLIAHPIVLLQLGHLANLATFEPGQGPGESVGFYRGASALAHASGFLSPSHYGEQLSVLPEQSEEARARLRALLDAFTEGLLPRRSRGRPANLTEVYDEMALWEFNAILSLIRRSPMPRCDAESRLLEHLARKIQSEWWPGPDDLAYTWPPPPPAETALAIARDALRKGRVARARLASGMLAHAYSMNIVAVERQIEGARARANAARRSRAPSRS